MFAGTQRGQRQVGAHVGHTGGVDDHVDVGVREGGSVGEDRVPLPAVGVRVDADRLVGADHPVRVDVGDGADLQAGDPLHLGDEPGAHLSGAGQADPDRAAGLCFPLFQPLGVTHDVLS